MKARKAILALHRWVGLVTGALVVVISLTGAVFVFEEEAFDLLNRRLVEVAGRGRPMLSAERLLAAGQAALGPGAKASWIEGSGHGKSVEVHAYEYDETPDGIWYWDEAKLWKAAYLDPYTGEVLGVKDRRFAFFNVVRQIHQNMLLRYQVGHYIVGVTVLVFLGMMLTGLALWWPRNRAALKQRVKVAWGSGKRRLRFDLHAVFGFYAWIPLLIIVATGLVWSFGWWGSGCYFLLSGETGDPWAEDPKIESTPPDSARPAIAAALPPQDSARAPAAAAPSTPLDIAFAEVMRRARPGTGYYVSLPKEEKGVLEASYQEPVRSGWMTYSDLKFDRHTGKLLFEDAFERKDIRKNFRYSLYNIHVGSIYGWPTQVLAFLASLLCATLPVTGFLMRLGRRRKARPALSPPSIQSERTSFHV